jgi:hypothetical protein
MDWCLVTHRDTCTFFCYFYLPNASPLCYHCSNLTWFLENDLEEAVENHEKSQDNYPYSNWVPPTYKSDTLLLYQAAQLIVR